MSSPASTLELKGMSPKAIQKTINGLQVALDHLEVAAVDYHTKLNETEAAIDRHYAAIESLQVMLDPDVIFRKESTPGTKTRTADANKTRAAIKHILRKADVAMRRVDLWHSLCERHPSFNRHLVESTITTMVTAGELIRVKRGHYKLNPKQEMRGNKALFDAPEQQRTTTIWNKADLVMRGSCGKSWHVDALLAELVDKHDAKVFRDQVSNYFLRRMRRGVVKRVAPATYRWVAQDARKKK